VSRQRTQFSTEEIVAFWYPHPTFYEKFDSEGDMADSCFRCGYAFGKLEKAHILPLNRGGADTIDNVHILCFYCHRTTEDYAVRFGRAYYDQMMKMTSSEGFTFHCMRIGLPTTGTPEEQRKASERIFMRMGEDGAFLRMSGDAAEKAQGLFRVARGRRLIY
jgi:hypothetical protein